MFAASFSLVVGFVAYVLWEANIVCLGLVQVPPTQSYPKEPLKL